MGSTSGNHQNCELLSLSLKKRFIYFYFMCMSVCLCVCMCVSVCLCVCMCVFVCVYVCASHVCPVPVEASKGSGSPGSGFAHNYGLPHTCWELNLGLGQEQHVL